MNFQFRNRILYFFTSSERCRMNTPVIIKFPFYRMTYQNKNARYVCINYDESYCPREIATRSVCINGDINKVLQSLI